MRTRALAMGVGLLFGALTQGREAQAALAAPTNVTIGTPTATSPTTWQVTLSFTPDPNAQLTLVQWYTDPSFPVIGTVSTDSYGTSQTVSGLPINQTYYFRVFAVIRTPSFVQGPYSPTLSATFSAPTPIPTNSPTQTPTPGPSAIPTATPTKTRTPIPTATPTRTPTPPLVPTNPPLRAPTNLTMGVPAPYMTGMWQVRLSWTAVPNAQVIHVEFTTDPGFTNPTSVDSSNGTDVTAWGMTNNKTYYFRALALIRTPSFSQGPYSATLSGTYPPPTTPGPGSFTQQGAGLAFTSASIGSAGGYGGISAGQLYAWNGSSFAPGGIALSQVAYGKDGTRWGVGSNGVIYRFGTSWTTVPGALKQISVGNASNVWGVNSAGSIYRWNGTGWVQMPGTFASVSVAADGTVWALQGNDSIWRWNGTGWVQFGGALRWISVGSASNVWGVNAGGQVYKVNAAASGWDMPTVPAGTYIGVSTASDGSTLLVRNDGTLWKK